MCAIRSDRTGSPEQCKTFAPNSARPSHRASEDPSPERVKPLHPSVSRRSPRSKGGVPLARREAFPSPEGRRSLRSNGGVPFARRLAFLRGGLFIFQIANFIVHYLVLIFTIQIYIGTLIFARRAYGVIL